VKRGNGFELDGRDLSAAILSNERVPRKDYLYFASETPIAGQYNLTAFNDEWKLVQEIQQGLLSATVTNYLFQIAEDPNEMNNLAAAHPEVVEKMAEAIHIWRQRYPVSGTHAELVPPPGWRAPKDWVNYPVPLDQLQAEPAPGMPPASALRILDWQHGEVGRLLYDCEPHQLFGGGVCR
jgi:arylsulfatase B